MKQSTKDTIESCSGLKYLYNLIMDTYETKKEDIPSLKKRRRLNSFFFLSDRMMSKKSLFKTCILNRLMLIYEGKRIPIITHCKRVGSHFVESKEGFICVKLVEGKGDREEMFRLIYKNLRKELSAIDISLNMI